MFDKESLEASIQFLEGMDPILDMVDGYQSKLEARQYSTHMIEQMVVDFHKLCMTMIVHANSGIAPTD